MNIFLEKISQDEFDRLEVPEIFTKDKSSRCYGVIKNDCQKYKLAWQSDLVEPVLAEVGVGIVSIGIDQHFALLDFIKNNVLLKLVLYFTFLDSKIFQRNLFIGTEFEVLRVNLTTYEVVNSYPLPEIFEEIVFFENSFIIKCAENVTIKIK